MDVLTLSLALALVAGALALILYPLWQQTRPEAIFQVDRIGQTLEEYQARYQASLAAIRDLMFDHEMDKVSTADYELLLAQAKLEAAGIRRQIDRLSQASGNNVLAPDLDREIEVMIAQIKRKQAAANTELLAEVEAEIELLKELETDADLGTTCPNCGQAIRVGDVFCSHCGRSLATSTPAAKVAAPEHACPNCGYAFQPGDAFCVKCGTSLPENVQPQEYEARV